MALLKFDAAPLLLGFVLGPLMEENLRRALLISRGDPSTFIDRPISAGILAFGACLVAWTLWGALRRQMKGQEAARDFSD
jgi:TctA family transporter